MTPLFVGSHPAIDFLNTSLAPNGEHIETIPDGRTYLDWFVGAGMLSQEDAARQLRRFGAKSLDQAAAEARRVREWVRSWLVRWRSSPTADYSTEIAALNKLLARQVQRLEIATTDDGPSLIERSHIESANALIALIAIEIAKLFTREEASLVRSCAGSACTLWFLDRTKAHRRMFCSTSTCGNRAKVAAFRERQRQ
jgi:predicted RNA-binding Zn ribbon-like protein